MRILETFFFTKQLIFFNLALQAEENKGEKQSSLNQKKKNKKGNKNRKFSKLEISGKLTFIFKKNIFTF